MEITWNDEKNRLLKETRSISFEQVLVAIENDDLIDIIRHPNEVDYAHQFILLVLIDNYVYAVPTVKENDTFFLKTIFPSRKYTKRYLGREDV